MEYIAKILENDRYGEWDAFVASHSLGNIHQTSQWGGFQAAKGKNWKFWIIGVFAEEKLVGGGVVLRRELPGGRGWLYIPKGPLVDCEGREAGERGLKQVEAMLLILRPLARQEKALFLRVESGLVAHGPRDFAVHGDLQWKKLGFRPAHAHYQPEHTLIVNLEGNDEAVLGQMKPKGRYNIKVARKKGVELLMAVEGPVEKSELISNNSELAPIEMETAVGEFHKLLAETTSRDGFAGHPRGYYLEMMRQLGPERVRLYLARYEGKIIAGIVVTFYKDLAIYYFGASSGEYRNVMAPYALQWEAMREAKRRGLQWYDFLGTAPLAEEEEGFSYDTKHSWAGVTEFKLKFGGKKVDFQPGWELVLAPGCYFLMRTAKWLMGLRRLGRGKG